MCTVCLQILIWSQIFHQSICFFCEIMAYHELFCMVKANYWEAQCNTTMTENKKINKTKL